MGRACPADITIIVVGKYNLTRGGITEGCSRCPAFMALPDFQTGTVWIHIRDMQGIAMSKAGCVQTRPVMIDGAGAVNNLIEAVAVSICHAEVMVSLPPVCRPQPAGMAGIEYPSLGQ